MSRSGSSPFEALKASSKQVYMRDMAFIAEIKRRPRVELCFDFQVFGCNFSDDRGLFNCTISFRVLSSVAL